MAECTNEIVKSYLEENPEASMITLDGYDEAILGVYEEGEK